jgi:hypothetical protein
MINAARAAILLTAAVAIAGCAATVDGTGRGSLATSSSPAASSLAPSASAPAATPLPTGFPSTSPAQALRRDPVSTPIGDPVTADICRAQGTAFLRPLGLHITLASKQFAAGCIYRGLRRDQAQIDVSEFVNSPSAALSGVTMRRVNGIRVYAEPLDRAGTCVRDVRSATFHVNVSGYAVKASRKSPKICQAADLAVGRVTSLLRARTRFPTVPLPDDRLSGLDLCKVARAAGLADDPLLAGARPLTFEFGAECSLTGDHAYAYLDFVTLSFAAVGGTTRTAAGSHTVLGGSDNDRARCSFISQQGKLADNTGWQAVEVYVSSTDYAHPPANLCARTKQLTADFLDAAGVD